MMNIQCQPWQILFPVALRKFAATISAFRFVSENEGCTQYWKVIMTIPSIVKW